MFILANWKIVSCVTSSGATVTGLCGHVFGNPQFKPGEFVQTSTVRSHRVEFDSLIVVTRNGSEYWLGKPDPGEPLAMQRLLRYLQDNASVQVLVAAEDRTRMGESGLSATVAQFRANRPAANPAFRRRATDKVPSPPTLHTEEMLAAIGPEGAATNREAPI